MKKIKKKNRVILCICLVVLILIIIAIFCYIKFLLPPTPTIKKISVDDNNNLKIEYNVSNVNKNNKVYYLFSYEDKMPEVNDSNWKLSTSNEIVASLNDVSEYYAYLKNENNKIIRVSYVELAKVNEVKINKEKVYIAIKGKYTVKAEVDSVGIVDNTISWYSDDESIATVDENGVITGVKKGETKVHAKVSDKEDVVDVLVTDLITVAPKNFNNNKPYLPCGRYNKEENDLLDEILRDRIEDAGGKGTRAAVVEVARFITLEFPYRIRYFSENGRLTINGVDGEGRYYHEGLYLDESRYTNITGKKSSGPKTWGCSMYCRPSHGNRPNGLDCSGFVSWVLLNGGFDVGDVGAGLTAGKTDLTDYGIRTKFNLEIVKSGKVKVGDLLSSGGVGGGHIALIAGEDDNYYYVAESLWTPPNVAVIIKPYSKKDLFKRYYYVMYMDSYYKKDGNLTKLWY